MQRHIPLLLIGVALELLGFAALIVFGQVTTITCERVEPLQAACVAERSWLGLFETGAAEPFTRTQNGGELTLSTPLTADERAEAARAIDDFLLAGSATTFTESVPPLQRARTGVGLGVPLIVLGNLMTINAIISARREQST